VSHGGRAEQPSPLRRAWRWMRATGKGEAVAGEPWIKREQRSIWLAVVVVLTLVLAAIGYLVEWWPELPLSAAPSKPPVPPPTPHGHILPPLPNAPR
jgi:hypothetical protein